MTVRVFFVSFVDACICMCVDKVVVTSRQATTVATIENGNRKGIPLSI